MKKLIYFILIFGAISTFFVTKVEATYNYAPVGPISSYSLEANKALSAISKQSFSKISVTDAQAYIEHFINNTSKYIKVPNSDDLSSATGFASDGTYSINIHPSMGCFHYAEFLATQIHGYGTQRLYLNQKKGQVTVPEFREFLEKNAQAGERLTIPSHPHSFSYVSSVDDGFYVLQYYGAKQDPFLSYIPYDYFVNLINEKPTEVFLTNIDPALNFGLEYSSYISPGIVTIKYNANGGLNPPISHNVVINNDAYAHYLLSSQTPNKDGYVFDGWRLGNSMHYDMNSPGQLIAFDTGNPAASITLTYYAQWR